MGVDDHSPGVDEQAGSFDQLLIGDVAGQLLETAHLFADDRTENGPTGCIVQAPHDAVSGDEGPSNGLLDRLPHRRVAVEAQLLGEAHDGRGVDTSLRPERLGRHERSRGGIAENRCDQGMVAARQLSAVPFNETLEVQHVWNVIAF